MITQILFQCLH